MDRKLQILDAYTSLGYKPKHNQVHIVSEILSAFLDKKKKNVVLHADTGIGKSIIAAVAAKVLSDTLEPELSSIILMQNNALVEQYAESFKELGDSKFFQVKGASNYSCEYLKNLNVPNTSAEECARKELTSFEQERYCDKCEFAESRKLINKSQNLITNYSYFLISKLWSEHLKDRLLTIFDEAHVLNEVFCEHTAIHFSIERLDYYIKELRDGTDGQCQNQAASLIQLRDELKYGKVNEGNYKQTIKNLQGIYSQTSNICDFIQVSADLQKKIKFNKMAKKYKGLACKIDDFFTHGYEHVFDDSVKGEITIKSIFVSDMMKLLLGQYNLFMSATITKSFVKDTFNLELSDTEFIEVEPVFPSENRPLFFIGKDSLNYQKMQDKSVIDNLKKSCGYVVNFHKNDKGLILTPSFKLAEELSRGISGVKVFEHNKDVKLQKLIEEFKEYKKPAVLISPSLFEGLDFSGDESRYQIIVKTPYPSLGDKRIKYIADNYPSMYKLTTLMKVVQGIGRSIRSVDDFAATYFLDENTKMLFNKDNVWKTRFEVKTK